MSPNYPSDERRWPDGRLCSITKRHTDGTVDVVVFCGEGFHEMPSYERRKRVEPSTLAPWTAYQ